MDNIREKIITINSVTNLNPEDKKPINFKDENGDKYVLWKHKKDGTETMAYSRFKNLPYGGDGATIGIAYNEEQKTFVNDKGTEVPYKQRSAVVVKNPNEVRPSNQVPNRTASTPKLDTQAPRTEVGWDKVSMGKCKHAYLVEAFKAHLGNPNIKLSEMEKIAEEWAKASMRILPTPTPMEKLLEKQGIQVGKSSLDTNEIPF